MGEFGPHGNPRTVNELLTSGWANLAGFLAVLAFLWNIQRNIGGLHQNIGELRERMARLEGMFEGFTGRKETPAGQ